MTCRCHGAERLLDWDGNFIAMVAQMLRPEPRVRPETTIGLRRRRLPQAVELAERSEPDFRGFIREFEESKLYRALRERGYVAKVALRGRIPKEKYGAYLDTEMVRLIREHGISDVPGWFDELSSTTALHQPQRFAAKYGVDAAVLRRVARYCRGLRTQDREPVPGVAGVVGEDGAWDRAESTAGTVVEDSGDATRICSEFVGRYGVGPGAFADDFLHGELRAAELAAKYGAPVEAVRGVLAAVESMQIFDAFAGSTTTAEPPASALPPAEELSVVASVERNPDTGIPVLTVDPDDVYAETYRLGSPGIKALYELAENTKEAEALLFKLRLINQRKTLLYRMLSAVFRHQFRYFSTADPLALRPLGQADVAREIEEHESTVSRLIRGKLLRFGGEERPLPWFCQKKRDVIQRIIEAHPELSDREVANLLDRQYGCKISRRTVNYHRGIGGHNSASIVSPDSPASGD
jgi:hypothetical protein